MEKLYIYANCENCGQNFEGYANISITDNKAECPNCHHQTYNYNDWGWVDDGIEKEPKNKIIINQ